LANLISSIGYAIGKVHTGMLAFLCDLHREGEKGPLESLSEYLGIKMPRYPRPQREWQSVDLAIFDGENAEPDVLIEMKVDDHEHETVKRIMGKKEKGYQTEIYAKAFPNCRTCLFITLGYGEYFRPPRGKAFRWIGLSEFANALRHVQSKERPIEDWKAAVHFEAKLRECVEHNDRSRLPEFRPGAWNICFLGKLELEFEKQFPGGFARLDPTCYTYGTKPDTILNFGWKDDPTYLEITNNGRLNLKANLEGQTDLESRKQTIQSIRAKIDKDSLWDLTDKGGSGASKSKTVAHMDIGVKNSGSDGEFEYEQKQSDTLSRLRMGLESVLGAPL